MSRQLAVALKLSLLFSFLVLLMGVVSQADHTNVMASLITSPISGPAPLAVTFNLVNSPPSSPTCIADSYTLEFSDGTQPATGNSSGPLTITHTYQNPGTYVAYLQYLMQFDHGTPMTPNCQQGIAFTPVVITVLQSGAATTIDGKAVAAYQTFEQLYSKLIAAKALAEELQNSSTESQSVKEEALGKLLLGADNLVQIALAQLEDLANQPELAGSALHEYISSFQGQLSANSPHEPLGFEALIEQAIEALETHNLAGVISAMDNALFLASIASIFWLDWESAERFNEIFTCSDGTTTYYATIISTRFNDNLSGTDGRDVINGFAGNDHISGAGGDDVICGGPGTNTISGGDGDDIILGGDDSELIDGGEGNDVLVGGTGSDALRGGAGNDTLRGGGGSDQLYGDSGNDNLSGDAGSDLLDGGDGDDALSGGDSDDLLLGGDNNDSLNGGAGNDILEGGAGNDALAGSDGDDVLFGGAGNDVLGGGNDDDQLYGEEGNDALSGAENVQADPSDNDQCDGGSGTGDTGQFCDSTANIP